MLLSPNGRHMPHRLFCKCWRRLFGFGCEWFFVLFFICSLSALNLRSQQRGVLSLWILCATLLFSPPFLNFVLLSVYLPPSRLDGIPNSVDLRKLFYCLVLVASFVWQHLNCCCRCCPFVIVMWVRSHVCICVMISYRFVELVCHRRWPVNRFIRPMEDPLPQQHI